MGELSHTILLITSALLRIYVLWQLHSQGSVEVAPLGDHVAEVDVEDEEYSSSTNGGAYWL